MRVLFIYGPPGVGKYTVAREIETQTGLKLLHNHMPIDWARPFFQFDTPEFWKVVDRLRETILEEAIDADVSLIVTFVHLPTDDLSGFRRICRLLEDRGSTFHLVNLVCSPETLKRRIGEASRLEMRKLSNLDALEGQLAQRDYFRQIPDVESVVIDNSTDGPKDVAQQIIRHFQLAGSDT